MPAPRGTAPVVCLAFPFSVAATYLVLATHFGIPSARADTRSNTASAPASSAKGPFHFRDAFLLELRIRRSGEDYSVSHDQDVSSQQGPSPAQQFLPDWHDPKIYSTSRWVELLTGADRDRRIGNVDAAEREYLEILGQLRTAQGPTSEAVVMVLDRIGEFYLELRRLESAYRNFSEALSLRKKLVEGLQHTQTKPLDPNAVNMPLVSGRLHVLDLLTRLGQIDVALSNSRRAFSELTEANEIGNESTVYRRFVGSLYPSYFLSLLLEAQGRWKEADDLWQKAVQGRETIQRSAPYWNALKEQAAFYARQGDFHRAAEIARRVQAGPDETRLLSELAMPYPLDPRSQRIGNPQQPQYSPYLVESDIAMSEIVAADTWRTDGPDVAASLLRDPVGGVRGSLDRGADAERAEILAWLERRVFLHMSVLLDGQPPPDRVAQAYTLLSEVKGRYLASGAELNRSFEAWRGNPNVQTNSIPMLDELAAARARRAHQFVAAALYGQPFDEAKFAAGEKAEQLLTEALAAQPGAGHAVFSLRQLIAAIPADSVLIDTVVWERTDRSTTTLAGREYGAFVLRAGQPVQYVRLGGADDIDADIALFGAAAKMGGWSRGFEITPAARAPDVPDMRPPLRSLYRKVLAPLEPLLTGAKKLLVVADSKLALAPIAALTDENGREVLERYTITYLTSWRDLDTSTVLPTRAPSASVVVGNPDFDALLPGSPTRSVGAPRFRLDRLPKAGEEATVVANALSVPQDRILLGARAREDSIRSLLGPQILHLATHSAPDLRWSPPAAMNHSLFEFPRLLAVQNALLQSVIGLAGANRLQIGPEDGLLTGLEVSSLRLSGTKLVVLSSCESAQGVPVDGQGVLGMRAALDTAGAEAVVMNLWPIVDEAGLRFMRSFYKHYANSSVGPADALREAQRDMKADPQFNKPFYWAGYMVSGTFRASRATSP
jgi:CHAT domain-containing protein/tetratricopeptide (TPR) repeat protein